MSKISTDIDRLLPARVQNVELYDPLRDPIIYDLSDNTSQWGMAPGVVEKIASLMQKSSQNNYSFSRYPDIYARSLKIALAKKYSQYLSESPIEQIVVGCGTDDVLDCTVRALSDENDTVLAPIPSFPMAGYFARFNGRKVETIELNSDGSIDVEAVIKFNAKIVYLCSPNNPTGLSLDKDTIRELLERSNGFVIVDEAYAEFSKKDCLELIQEFPNLVIMRTFSKLHALAGLRIGFGLGNEKVISAIEALRGPYKANSIAIEAAIASLSQLTYQSEVVKETQQTREWFILELTKLGLSPLDSDSNFVFIPMKSVEGIKSAFSSAEIAVRVFDELPVYGSGIRITVAPKEILMKVLSVLISVKPGSK